MSLLERIRQWREGLEWQDYCLAILLLAIAVMQFSLFSKFTQLPGPVYGGDIYLHYGHTVNIHEGGSVFKSSHYINEWEHYPWLTHLSIALLAWIFFTTPLAVAIIYPIIIMAASGIVMYIIARKVFDEKIFALVAAVAWAAFGDIPSPTPTSVALKIMIPLTAYAIFTARSLRQRLLAGLVFGLAGLQHVVAFLGSILFAAVCFFTRVFHSHIRFEEGKLRIIKTGFFASIAAEIKFFLPMAVVAVPVALLYWSFPIFVYKGITPNAWQEYTGLGLQGIDLAYVWRVFSHFFTDFTTWITALFSLVALYGLFYCISRAKKFALPLLILAAGLLGTFHPLITKPLLGTSFGFYRFPIIIESAKIMFFAAGVYSLHNILNRENYRKVFIAMVFVFLIFNSYQWVFNFKNDRWFNAALPGSAANEGLFEMAGWILKNTGVNDVFLASHEESGFAVNALTGRKIVIMRRTHTSPYVDVDSRTADAAVMLYGSNESLRQKLLEKYRVKYYYEDFYSSTSRMQCLSVWNSLGGSASDDLSYNCLRTNLEYEDYLLQNNITFKRVNARLDPASSVAPKYDILAIKPGSLALKAEEMHKIEKQGQLVAKVYKVA